MLKSRSSRLQLAAIGGINLLVLALFFAFSPAIFSTLTPAKADGPIMKAAKGELRPAVLKAGNTSRTLPFFSGGTLDAATAALKGDPSQSNLSRSNSIGVSADTLGCSNRNPFNDGSVRVNQDCTYRRQAEESIAANPVDPRNLIAGQNDSRIGFNHCGFDYSFDSGKNWGDGIPPFFQRLNNPPAGHTIVGGPGTNHTYDAASDPAIAFDSQGNAFYSCIAFDVNTDASAVLVARSPAAAGGSFYNNVPAAGSSYVAVEDNSPRASHDKEFIVADSFTGSPFRDNVYVTWTVFKFACGPTGNGFCSSPIFFSRSTNHALTWSKPVEISGNNPNLCFFGNFFDPTRNANDCDFDQGSDPKVLPDGTIVVTFNNGNTAAGNPNSQQLAVRSTDGGMSWSAPVKVGDDITVGEPLCNFGRGPEECVPGPFIRTNDFPRIAVDPNRGTLYVTWQDFRSGKEYDIQLAESTDGGLTWTGATAPVNPVNPSKALDHYMPDVGVSTKGGPGSNVAVSYYRSPEPQTPAQIGTIGQEYFLSGGIRLETPFEQVQVAPMTPAPDGIQAGFNGDYSGLVVVGKVAHPIWSDTRDAVPGSVGPQGVMHDEDIFTIAVHVPGGQG
jgi:hypothetical protein